ncbi:MAG: hypothetical protein LBM01_00755 [Christensenellaceae bacterium]|jgi:hypothetical protein|nr:hypothetical protein [Christensenellaceae bacterium]
MAIKITRAKAQETLKLVDKTREYFGALTDKIISDPAIKAARAENAAKKLSPEEEQARKARREEVNKMISELEAQNAAAIAELEQIARGKQLTIANSAKAVMAKETSAKPAVPLVSAPKKKPESKIKNRLFAKKLKR